MRSRTLLALGAAAVWAVAASAAVPSSGDPEFNPVCHFDAPLCGKFKALKDKLDAIAPVASYPFPAKPGLTVSEDQLARFNAEYRAIADGADHVLKRHPEAGEKLAQAALERLRRRLDELTLRTVEFDLKNNPLWLSRQEGLLDALENDVRRLEPWPSRKRRQRLLSRLDKIDLECAALWNYLRQTSDNVDYADPKWPGVGDGVFKNRAAQHVETANVLHRRAAALRDRLQDIACRLGRSTPSCPMSPVKARAVAKRLEAKGLLGDPFAAGRAGDRVGAAAAAVSATSLGAAARSPRRSLLDMPRPPAPSLARRTPKGSPPIELPVSSLDMYPEETRLVATVCAAGHCRPIGNPELHKKLVYRQKGSTCGIGAQVMIMRWLGLGRGTTPEKMEDALYAEALRQGYFTGKASDPKRRDEGRTPWKFLGSLLPARPDKRYLASDGDLLRAVASEKLILVTLDARKLWNNNDYKGLSHAVVITGALVLRRDGELLGYYINDTGQNQGGRFVNAKQFREAWHANGRVFVEPL